VELASYLDDWALRRRSARDKKDEAIAECRVSLRLKPNYPHAHFVLAGALREQGKVDEAISECSEALRLRATYPEAHAELGSALRSRGDFTDAIAELRKARGLANPRATLAQQIESELIATERQASRAAQLPAVLAGQLKPAIAAEILGFAEVCCLKKLYVGSARLWAQAFQVQPKLVDDVQAQNRYNAACSAALAGCGKGKDNPALDDGAKVHWRKQAIDWLRADLAAWSTLLDTCPPPVRQSAAETLQHWKVDPDLAGVRDPDKLANLPKDEQKACRALFAEVDALLAKARGGTKP
jgi:serine/threonine-protein kinase